MPSLPPTVDLAALPTSIEPLPRLTMDHPGTHYVKRDDRTAGIAQGNKVRKLEYLLADAIEHDADTVVTIGGLQSNHCRATAVTARRLGLDPHLLLHGDPPDVLDGNLLLDALAGATIKYLTTDQYHDARSETVDQVLEDLEDQGRTPYYIPAGGSNPLGTLGYFRAYNEIHDDMTSEGRWFGRIYFATGSAGTQAGLVAGSLYHDDPVEIVGVTVSTYSHDDLADTITRNVLGAADLVPDLTPTPEAIRDRLHFLDYTGPGYAEPADEDLATIREAGRKEGLVLDTCYTGKAFRAFLEHTRPDETNLFIHTGGSYGLFPHRDRLTTLLT